MPKRKSASSRLVDVHYRRLVGEGMNLPNVTLAELLREALKHKSGEISLRDDVRRRVQHQAPENLGDVRCWNNVKVSEGRVFGTLCLYRPRELQAMIRARGIQEELTAFPLSQVGEAGGEDFLRAISYWMAIEDHFYLIQAPSIQTIVMEDYFNWLLKSVNILTDNQPVVLETRFDRSVIGGDLDNLQSIIIGGPAEPPDCKSDGNSDVGSTPKAVELHLDENKKTERHLAGDAQLGNGWNLLQYFATPERLQHVTGIYRNLQSQDPTATLSAEVAFVVHTHSRSKSSQDMKQEMLKAMHSSFRNMPDGAVKAKGKHGIATSQDIRLKRPRRIRLADLSKSAPDGAKSSLLDIDATFDHLEDVHQCLQKDEVI